jgi:hypothetical protein
LENFTFALVVTAPVFVIFCVGILLKRVGMINNEFARIGSELVFKVTLPCLLFVKLVDARFDHFPLALLLYAALATIAVFLLLDRFVAPFLAAEDRGAFVQGSFRGNMGIVGLAYCLNAYGEGVIPLASIYMAFMTILFNVLAVITLNRHLVNGEETSFITTLKKIISNPLILAIVLALSLSFFSVPVPAPVLETLGYFAAMTLPLALLCGGAAIRWREFHSSGTLYWATAAKLVLVPGLIVIGGIVAGFRGEALGVLYFMVAAPTAAASYPMTRAIGGNHFLSAAIIATTSLGGILATTLGLFLLREFGLV